jgi:nucleoside-diphosphate-sugar epimerase
MSTAHDAWPTARDRDRSSIDGPDQRVGRFAGARILIVGCGDVGLRLIDRLGDRFRIHAMTRSPDRIAALRAAGVVPIVADLDDPGTLGRLAGIAPNVVHLAPPPGRGSVDTRTRTLLRHLSGVERLIYVSTSGVYGDCQGRWIDETRAVAPGTDRGRRRVDAERRLRAWARSRGVRLTILRVPGIYAADRLPLARFASGTPVLRTEDDVYTNHVHADDLARLIADALSRGAPQRIYHAVDDSAIRMGDWFDLIAEHRRLPRPERVSRAAIAERVDPNLLSFMRESRRLSNRRMHTELGMRLAYPTVRDGLDAASDKKQGPA